MKQEPQKTELELSQSKAEEHLNNWKRAQADFENYRKDEKKRVAEVVAFTNERMILEVADIIDNLEMVLKHAPPDTKQDWLEGARQILKQWQTLLKKHGIERMVTTEQQFDPHKYEAVDGRGSTVVEEVRAGYEMSGKVIRPARVKVN
ncbi:MAG: nucleotide exchange factor GrpE [Patescibacteria group bacterium]